MRPLSFCLFAFSLLPACYDASLGDAPAPAPVAPTPTASAVLEGTLPTGFLEAADLTNVPGELLLAIANTETSLQMVEGQVEFDGKAPTFGVMGLSDSLVTEAALASGYTEDEIRFERVPNVVATAMLLEQWATDEGIDTTVLASWAPVVADYSGITDEEALAEYIHYEVYQTLKTGLDVEGLELKPQDIVADWPLPARETDRTGEAGTIWTPSPNHSSRGGASVDFVIIHTCEGSYSSCWGWLKNPNAGASAHYVVSSTGSEVRRLVDEDRKAWHISASYSCSRNGNFECYRNGSSTSAASVGIEHAGSASQTSWNEGLLDRSAELTCGIATRHDIPIDRYHVIGHGEMQPWNRTDPGAAWPWSSYMAKIEDACGVGTPEPPPLPTPDPETNPDPIGVPFIIDSNNGANNTAHHYVEVSSNWSASSNVRGHYNTGYWYAPTASVSDSADFKFRVDQASQCYRVEAWWPAAGDRPTNVVWLGWNADDNEVGRTTVNQRIDGGRWNELGRWTFNQGWNKVMLSRWTTPGDYAVADAVRLTPATGCN